MKKNTLPFLVLVFFLSGCASIQDHKSQQRNPTSLNRSLLCQNLAAMEIHSHRGAADRPENTKSAFLRAAEIGADVVEMDLQVSQDKEVVVAHDPYIKDICVDSANNPVRNNEFFFGQMSLKEIQSFRCGKRKIKEQIMTLAEALELLKPVKTKRNQAIGLNIEIKYYPHLSELYPSRAEYAELVLKAIQSSGIPLERIMIQSFDIETLKMVRERHSTITLSPLLDKKNIQDGVQIAQALSASIVTPDIGYVSPKILNDFQQAGIRVIPWTVNSTKDALNAIELGANGAITDRPELFEFAQKFCE